MSEKSTLISREEAALRLGFSVGELRRRERLGQIKHTKKGAHNTYLYAAEDVQSLADAIANQRGGYTAAEASIVFKLLAAGKTLVDCVIEGGVRPEAVEGIALQYAQLSKTLIITASALSKINAMTVDGPMPINSEAELIEMFEFMEKQKCFECGKGERTFCKSCVHKTIKAVQAKAVAVANGTDDL